MAGGKGERFWPRSRETRPKQLQKVYSSKTLLQETWDRALQITTGDRIFIGCNAALKEAVLKTHSGIPEEAFVVEPAAKNTAPIVALASLVLEQRFPGSVQVVLSADHFIAPPEEFTRTMNVAISAASENEVLVTIGIPPTRPETGYGYIHTGTGPSEDSGKTGSFPGREGTLKIEAFVEKPDAVRAAQFVAREDYFWNSGMFIWKGSTILEEFHTHARQIIEPIEKAVLSGESLEGAFEQIPSEPVDIAILEKSKRVVMTPSTFRWDDVGSWLSLERILDGDSNGNTLVSEGQTVVSGIASSNNVILSNREVVALLGIKDTIIVEEDDLLFVASREHVGRIKELLSQFRENPSLQKYLK